MDCWTSVSRAYQLCVMSKAKIYLQRLRAPKTVLYFKLGPLFCISTVTVTFTSRSRSVCLMTTTGWIMNRVWGVKHKIVQKGACQSYKRISVSVMNVRFASAVCHYCSVATCWLIQLHWILSYSDRCACVCVCVCYSLSIHQASYRIIMLQKDHSSLSSVAFLIHLSSFSQSVPWWEPSIWQVWMRICVNVAVGAWACVCKGSVISVTVSLWAWQP